MKQIKRKKLPSALVQALGAGVAVSVMATAAHAQQAQRVEKIEVTGSNIKRVDVEGTPVVSAQLEDRDRLIHPAEKRLRLAEHLHRHSRRVMVGAEDLTSADEVFVGVVALPHLVDRQVEHAGVAAFASSWGHDA